MPSGRLCLASAGSHGLQRCTRAGGKEDDCARPRQAGTAAAEKVAEGRTAQLFPSSVPLDGRGAAGNSRSADRAELPLRCFGLAAGAAGRSMRAVLWAGAARRLHGLWPLHRRLPDRGSRAGARRACGPALCGGILHRVQSLCTALPAGRAGTRAALCRAARFPAGPLTYR